MAAVSAESPDPGGAEAAINGFVDLGHLAYLAHTVESLAVREQARAHTAKAARLLGIAAPATNSAWSQRPTRPARISVRVPRLSSAETSIQKVASFPGTLSCGISDRRLRRPRRSSLRSRSPHRVP